MTCYTLGQGCHSSIWVPSDHVRMNHPATSAARVFPAGRLRPGHPLFPSLALTHDWLLPQDLYLGEGFIGNVTKGLAVI
jgi:hypothetical protein